MLVLHIGPHKTATTYIQQNLYLSREDLNTIGWLYPAVGRHELHAHHDLAHNPDQYLKSGGLYYDEFAQLPNLPEKGKKNIIFSAEGFCRWKPEQFSTMAEIMNDDDLHLVYVIRDPISVFYSYWTEEVKQGYTASLPERFCQHFNDPFHSRLLNPLIDLTPLMELTAIKLHVILFERIHQLELDLFKTLLSSVMKVDNVEPRKYTRSNESYPIELTEFLRLLTRSKANGERYVGSSVRHAFIKCTTANERHEIAKTVTTYSSMARRSITVPRDTVFLRTLERQIHDQLSATTIPEIDEESIFLKEEAVLPYYDELSLQTEPIVAALLDHYANKIEAYKRL